MIRVPYVALDQVMEILPNFHAFQINHAHFFILIMVFNLQSYHLCHLFQKFSLRLLFHSRGRGLWSILIHDEFLRVVGLFSSTRNYYELYFSTKKYSCHTTSLLMEVLAYQSIFCLRFHTQWNSRRSIVIVARMMFSKDMDIVNATIHR